MKNFIIHFNKFLKKFGISRALFIELSLGLIFAVGSFVLFIHLRSEVLEKEFGDFDNSIINFIYSYRSEFLTQIMIFITNFGTVYLIGLCALITAILAFKKRFKAAAFLSFTTISAVILNIVLKDLTGRARPQMHPLIVENDFSFPSGHAMDSLVFYMSLAYLVFHFTRSKKLTLITGILFSVLVLFIGISRIYLGVHYPTDILAGYIAGLFWLTAVLLVMKTLDYFKNRKN